MTNTKHTRKALLSSVVALLLCFSMLMGTTFAWFTDSVTSANNIIQSGKLDVTMEYSDSVTTPNWQDASGTAIFDYELWEPGYVEVKYIKIANAGNLAFRYELSVIPETQPAAGEVNLADVIDVYFYEFPAGAPLADITKDQLTDALKVGTLTDMMAENDGAAHGVILPLNGSTNVTLKAEDEAIAREGETVAVIALKMQETAGNEYQGKDVGGTFAVQLLATQYTYEKDSFDNQFDNDSTYPAVDTVTVPENNTEDVVLSTETVKVTVPAASAQEGDDYKIVVSNETVETDSATGETTVGFDLTMYKNDAKVSGDTVYEVEWNVGTGLIISEVTHNGTALTQATTGADQTYTYDAATGVLTIYTKSFSPFEVTYTALKETFADNSWDIIIQACQSNSVPASWSVGDKKAMTIGGSTYDIVIIGKNHDAYSDGSGKAPLTFQLADVYGTTAAMNATQTNATGWSASQMRTTTMVEILSAMPAEVQNAIKAVDKETLKGDGSGLETTSDKLFLMSLFEVYGSTFYSNGYEEGSMYAYYASINDRIMSATWWLRGPGINNGKNNGIGFTQINMSGYMANGSAEYACGVVFGFCF